MSRSFQCNGSARLLIALLAISHLTVPRESNAASPPARPNVLMIAADDLRDWINCLGGYRGKVLTPHLDRLARQGTLFTNAHTASPVCCPSRAAVMSGRLPSSTGVYSNQHWWKPHRPDLVTIPAHFRSNGYLAVGAGKLFHHTVGNNPPGQWDAYRRLVFDDDGFSRTGNKYAKLYPFTRPQPVPPAFPYSGLTLYSPEVDWGVLPKGQAEFDDAHSAEYAVRFLSMPHAQPFFLAVGFFRPHLPWYTPAEFADLYDPSQIQFPEVRDDDLNDIPEAGRGLALRKFDDLQKVRQAGEWKRAVQMYLASITFMDAQVGRVLDALEQSDAADHTIIVFWSDHGWHFGEKQHWHKRTLWEPATRVPLIVAWPGKLREHARCAEAVSLLDLFPTLIELCQLAPVTGLDGESLAPLIKTPNATRDRPAITVDEHQHVAVRDERYRLIRYADGSGELYDLHSDPNEWTNRIDDPQLKDIREQLSRWLPTRFAKAARPKSAYEFDPFEYRWTVKATGQRIDGGRCRIEPAAARQ